MKVLILRLSALGDVLDAMAVPQALKAKHPQAQIHFLVEDRFSQLVSCLPAVDQVKIFPRQALKKMTLSQRLKSLRFLKDELNREAYDWVLDLHGNFRSALLSLKTKAKRKGALPKSAVKEGHAWFPFQRPHGAKNESRLDQSLSVARLIDSELSYQGVDLKIPESVQEKFGQQKKQLDLGNEPYLLVCPGTSRKGRYKRWSLERYQELFKSPMFSKIPVVLSAGPDEEQEVQGLATATGCHLLKGHNQLELLAWIKGARLFLSPDNGPLHMAHFLRIPTVSLWGPKHPDQYGPQHGDHRKLYVPMHCSPCRNWQCSHVSCMKAITVPMVESAIGKALNR